MTKNSTGVRFAPGSKMAQWWSGRRLDSFNPVDVELTSGRRKIVGQGQPAFGTVSDRKSFTTWKLIAGYDQPGPLPPLATHRSETYKRQTKLVLKVARSYLVVICPHKNGYALSFWPPRTHCEGISTNSRTSFPTRHSFAASVL